MGQGPGLVGRTLQAPGQVGCLGAEESSALFEWHAHCAGDVQGTRWEVEARVEGAALKREERVAGRVGVVLVFEVE